MHYSFIYQSHCTKRTNDSVVVSIATLVTRTKRCSYCSLQSLQTLGQGSWRLSVQQQEGPTDVLRWRPMHHHFPPSAPVSHQLHPLPLMQQHDRKWHHQPIILSNSPAPVYVHWHLSFEGRFISILSRARCSHCIALLSAALTSISSAVPHLCWKQPYNRPVPWHQ